MLEMKVLNFCSVDNMTVWLEMLFDLLVEQVSGDYIPVAEMQDGSLGYCRFFHFVCCMHEIA